MGSVVILYKETMCFLFQGVNQNFSVILMDFTLMVCLVGKSPEILCPWKSLVWRYSTRDAASSRSMSDIKTQKDNKMSKCTFNSTTWWRHQFQKVFHHFTSEWTIILKHGSPWLSGSKSKMLSSSLMGQRMEWAALFPFQIIDRKIEQVIKYEDMEMTVS